MASPLAVAAPDTAAVLATREPPPWDDANANPNAASLLPPPWDTAVEPVSVALPKSSAEPLPKALALPVRDPGLAERPAARQPVPVVSESTEIATGVEGEFWLTTVQALMQAEAVTALVRELALQSQLVAREPGRWLLRVERESLTQGGSQDRLCAALQAHGHAIELALEVGPVQDSPARRIAAAATHRQHEAEQLILADPFVQTMMRDFGGRIVPGTLKALSS